MKIYAMSDIHGTLVHPEGVPSCDILIIAGDTAPVEDHSKNYQYEWYKGIFSEWLRLIPAKIVIGIGGNHDFVLQNKEFAVSLPWYYLQDDGIEFHGLKFWGTPWVPNLKRWAFHANDQTLYKKYRAIPDDTDVVITHGPPFYVGDLSSEKFGRVHCGHKAVNEMMLRVRPKLTVCGHIHEAHGLHYYDGLPMFNVSRLDDNYALRYPIEDVSRLLRPS